MHPAQVVWVVRYSQSSQANNYPDFEIDRCQAPSRDLDQDSFVPCHMREFTTALLERVLPNVLWDEYGIVGDLVISRPLVYHRKVTNISKPFTNDFPRANIHLLLAPDLLHQLIKGCFKDHLVDWIVAYIQLRYTPQRESARVLDEIDCR